MATEPRKPYGITRNRTVFDRATGFTIGRIQEMTTVNHRFRARRPMYLAYNDSGRFIAASRRVGAAADLVWADYRENDTFRYALGAMKATG